MGTLRITEAELARDIHAVLAKVREGAEILVEEDHHAVAVIRSPLPKGRLPSECIALAEARGSSVTLGVPSTACPYVGGLLAGGQRAAG